MPYTKLLVVEDEEIVAFDIESTLMALGYDVIAVVPSGEEAIQEAATNKPDLVLMDIRLKGSMDGIQAGSIIKQFNIPVVYLTAHADTATLQRAKITTPFGYLVKPFEEIALQTTIEIALSRHQAEEILRKSEAQLKQQAQELEQALTELQQTQSQLIQTEKIIQLSLAKEKELNELKASFISMISHDLRTPMTTIFGATELLEIIYSKYTGTKANKYIEQVKKAIHRMVELLDDVLLMSKASDRKLVCRPVSLDLTNFCLDLTKEEKLGAGRDNAISFTNHGQCTNVFADPSLLLPILRNLLANAIKYSPQGDTIQFEIDCQNNEAIFQIQDHGIGIPPKDLNKLFTSFHRATNVGNIPGTGLGLSIVKNCVNLHGGQIEVESEVGVGTKFRVRIPLNYQGAVDEKDIGD
ncbi:MAG TPA: ATP-binding protein [Oculatellaceae cyanobacterium]|jgi:signal transduction histidine kinase